MTKPTPARAATLALALAMAGALRADPLSKKAEVDFYRDVSSRELRGLATRSDGRLVAGPSLSDLAGRAPSDLLWCLEPGPAGTWLVGGGPGGRVLEVTLAAGAGSFESREIASLGQVQVFALAALPDGAILAGTSPGAGLFLIRAGKVAAHVGLPADSVYDLLPSADGKSVLAATGNPGRIYRIDIAALGSAKPDAALEARGVTLFGEIADANVRRIARLADGQIAAGSSPKGCLYLFPAAGGPPFIAQENREAEVTDILPDPKGGYYAAIVFSGGEIHPVQSQQQGQPQGAQAGPSGQQAAPTPAPAPGPGRSGALAELLGSSIQVEQFQGRSTLQWFGPEGFPDTLAVRQGAAFYRLARHGDLIVISGGEKGELMGYDLAGRMSLTFPGSASSQVNDLRPVPGQPGRFLALRNNAPGFALLDFGAGGSRTAETRRIDLGAPARLGALRFGRLRDIDASQIGVEVRTTNAANENDGWSPWARMAEADGWRAQVPTGRYAELRITVAPGSSAAAQMDKASLYYLTQNHRPQLTDFRVLSPGYAISAAPEPAAPVTTTIAQLMQAGDHDGDKRRASFQSSQVFASPGARVIFWNVVDPDGDNLVYTFSIRHESEAAWTDIAVDSKESFVQFDTLHLREGTWFTRLVAKETAPRPAAERLTVSFETDDLVVDHTPPDILDASARRDGGRIVVTVRGRDALSLLDSAEFTFNNGLHEVVEQPADGILDGREESFVLEVPADRAAGATSVEVTLYDDAGNGATRRLSL